MSGFLDNIAAAMIGGTLASALFARRVHVGYLAAIVAASNAGGAGSVSGDTTTTMMWIAGASRWVLEAYCRWRGCAGGLPAVHRCNSTTSPIQGDTRRTRIDAAARGGGHHPRRRHGLVNGSA